MALGFGRKSASVADNEKVSPRGVVETRDPTSETNAYDYDAEKGATAARKGSRVADPIVVDDASVVSVGKQMELEASNSIKYRTCTWQKVSPIIFLRELVLEEPTSALAKGWQRIICLQPKAR